MLLVGAALSLSISFLSQLGSFGIIGGYFLIVIGVPQYLRRVHLLRGSDIAVSLAASDMADIVMRREIRAAPSEWQRFDRSTVYANHSNR
jgi:hypothetical protein